MIVKGDIEPGAHEVVGVDGAHDDGWCWCCDVVARNGEKETTSLRMQTVIGYVSESRATPRKFTRAVK